MVDGNPQIELRIGDNEVLLQGSEEFISEELSTILDNIDLTKSPASSASIEQESSAEIPSPAPSATQVDSESDTEISSPIAELADNISVDPELINSHFYIEDDNIHLQDSYAIPQKYALIGYCLLKQEMTGQTVFDNSSTKEKLVDEERVPIQEWGATFLYNLREDNIIKNDPSSDKNRNVPFKITPKAEKQFREWLLNEDD